MTVTKGLRLGLGCAQLGNLGAVVSDVDARGAILSSIEAGVRFLDTAPHYGLGLSERRLGSVLAGLEPGTVEVCSKVGWLLEPVAADSAEEDDAGFRVPRTHVRRYDLSERGVRMSVEASLERLGVSRLDIVLIHDPDDHLQQVRESALPTLRRMADEGLVGRIGVGMTKVGPATTLVRTCELDVVMIAGRYTLMDQRALDTLFPACLDRGVRVIAAGPFNSGLLATDDPVEGLTFDYLPANEDQLWDARAWRDLCREFEVSLPAVALQFPLAHPAVDVVVAGAASAEQATRNCQLVGQDIPSDLWATARHRGLLPLSAPVPVP